MKKNGALQEFCRVAKISQVAKFCNLRKAFPIATVQVPTTVHFLAPFYFFDSFVTFLFASHFTLYVIVIFHVIW